MRLESTLLDAIQKLSPDMLFQFLLGAITPLCVFQLIHPCSFAKRCGLCIMTFCITCCFYPNVFFYILVLEEHFVWFEQISILKMWQLWRCRLTRPPGNYYRVFQAALRVYRDVILCCCIQFYCLWIISFAEPEFKRLGTASVCVWNLDLLSIIHEIQSLIALCYSSLPSEERWRGRAAIFHIQTGIVFHILPHSHIIR